MVVAHKKLFGLVFILYSFFILMSIVSRKDYILYFNISIIFFSISIVLFINDELLMVLQILFSLTIKGLTDYLHFPSSTIYISDYFTLILLLKIIFVFLNKKEIKVKSKKLNMLFLLIFLMLLLNLISLIINRYSLLNFIWGIRNDYKFFVAFIGYLYLDMSEKTIEKITRLLLFIFFLQLPAVLIQYSMGYIQDDMGGTFGLGATGVLGHFMAYIFAIAFSKYLNRKISIVKLISVLAPILVITVLSEIKIMYVYIAIILVYLMLRNKFKLSYAFIGLATLILMVFSSQKLGEIYPDFNNFWNINTLVDYSYTRSYGDGGAINRLSGPAVIYTEVMDNNYKKYFGVGLGNAAPNQHERLKGRYNEKYDDLKYYWFFIPYYLMENGTLGLGLYIILLVYLLIIMRSNKTDNIEEKVIVKAVEVCIIINFISLIYNNGILTDQIGFTFWFLVYLTFRNKFESIKTFDSIQKRDCIAE